MDVGNPDFRFTKLYQNDSRDERVTQPVRASAYAELHVDSLDRYHDIAGGQNQLQETAKLTTPQSGRLDFNGTGQKFVINTKQYLINGYFNRIGVSQINLFYRVPTVVTGVNDTLAFYSGPVGAPLYYTVVIPQGYYTLTTMATQLQVLIRAATGNAAFSVATNTLAGGFTFATNTADVFAIAFGSPLPVLWTEDQQQLYYRTARMLGAGRISFGFPTETAPVTNFQTSVNTFCPNLLFTDYIDIVSSTLCKFKRVKDTNSTDTAQSDVIARVYLCAQDTRENMGQGDAYGSRPFVINVGYKNINWCKWSPEESLQQIDITLLDMFGNPLPWTTAYGTEFQMTLLASES